METAKKPCADSRSQGLVFIHYDLPSYLVMIALLLLTPLQEASACDQLPAIPGESTFLVTGFQYAAILQNHAYPARKLERLNKCSMAAERTSADRTLRRNSTNSSP